IISWERESEPGVRYYGLGARTGSSLNLRGMLVQDAVPFLISTAGYGEQHVAAGKYDFDLERLRRGRYRVDVRGSDTIDYFRSELFPGGASRSPAFATTAWARGLAAV